MKVNHKNALFIAPTLVLITFAQAPISAITSAKSSSTKLIDAKGKEKTASTKTGQASRTPEEDLKSKPEQDKLVQLAQAFQEKPDDNTYNALWENFVAFSQQQVAKYKDPSHLFKSWESFITSRLKSYDPVGSNEAIHIYVFNRPAQNTNSFVPQTKYALIQWNEQSASTPVIKRSTNKKAWTREAKTTVVMKVQSINVPSCVDVKEG